MEHRSTDPTRRARRARQPAAGARPPATVSAVLRAVVFQTILLVSVIPYAFLCLLCAPLPLRWRYRVTMGWPRLAIWAAGLCHGIRWQVVGLDNLPERPAVILAKHQSAWETLFLPAHFPHEICFVYKRELHHIPFFGWGLALLRMIPINRSNRRDAMAQVLETGARRLDEGRWPLLFPEGTRIAPGQEGRYKAGGARLAVHAGAPVVPIAHNAGECWPRKAFIKRPGLVTVSIGPPIDTTGLDADTVNQRARDWIEAEMRRLNPERYPAA